MGVTRQERPEGGPSQDEGELEVVHRTIDVCQVCHLRAGISLIKSPPIDRGPASAPLFLIGMAPSAAVRRHSKAFAGNSLTRLYSWFQRAGFSEDRPTFEGLFYRTSLIKCAPVQDTASNRRSMYGYCSHFLWRQISLVQPKVVLCLGHEPASRLHFIKGTLTTFVGRVLKPSEVNKSHLFRALPITGDYRVAILPHPSGRSQMMNNARLASAVYNALRSMMAFAGLGSLMEQKGSDE